ncbi:MAG: hypothetical protein JWQ62_2518, partial [Lacunisphaera sp.]|nr:hypothetical protein [Lacunisphaera sp.]
MKFLSTAAAAIGLLALTASANDIVEQKIWKLLDDPKAVYVSLDTPSFMS